MSKTKKEILELVDAYISGDERVTKSLAKVAAQAADDFLNDLVIDIEYSLQNIAIAHRDVGVEIVYRAEPIAKFFKRLLRVHAESLEIYDDASAAKYLRTYANTLRAHLTDVERRLNRAGGEQ